VIIALRFFGVQVSERAGRGQICFKAWSEGNARALRALQTTIRDAIRVVAHYFHQRKAN